MEGDRHRLRLREDRLRELELLAHLVEVVQHDAGVAELGPQLRNDVHAVLGHVLQRRSTDRQRGVQRDQVDRRDVVQLGVGDAARPELGGGASGGQTAGNPAGSEVVAERHEARHVFAHRLHARDPVARVPQAEERLEVLGHVDEPATVDAREEGHAPLAQGVDEREVAAGPVQRSGIDRFDGGAHVSLLEKKKAPALCGGLAVAYRIRLNRGRPLAEPNKGQEYEYGKGARGHWKPNPTTRKPASSCVSMTNRPRPAGWRR